MMKILIFSLLLCLISLSAVADSLCNNGGSFDAESGMCISTSGSYSQGSPANQAYQPRDYYGALAANTVTGKGSGHADDYLSQHAAEAGALKTCGHSGCQIIISYKNTCGATAVPLYSPEVYSLVYGATGDTPEMANTNAINTCKAENPDVRCAIWSEGSCSYRE